MLSRSDIRWVAAQHMQCTDALAGLAALALTPAFLHRDIDIMLLCHPLSLPRSASVTRRLHTS